jgi:uncharacterized protein (TIGR02145 family)
MTGVKKLIRRPESLFFFLAALLFTCEEVPDYCGKGEFGELYDASCKFCFDDAIYDLCGGRTYNPLTQSCVKDSVVDEAPSDSAKKLFAVKVSSDGKDAKGSGSYAKGDTVRIEAGTPPEGQKFKNWTSEDSVSFADAKKEATAFIMPAKAVTVTAVFEVVMPPDSGFDYGTFTDDSDGKTYRTIKIDGQTWMAQNLDYEMSDGTGSWCYENSADSCAKYGRLYNWATAKMACPIGWRLPSNQDWEALVSYADGSSSAGKKLKSVNGWKSHGGIAATDELGFSALPGGYRTDGGLFTSVGEKGYWWIRAPADAYGLGMTYDRNTAETNGFDKGNGFSVRCLK